MCGCTVCIDCLDLLRYDTMTQTSYPEIFQQIDVSLEEFSDSLRSLSLSIWNHPETAYEEVHAHDCLTSFLEKAGFDVTRHYRTDTAFRAEYSSQYFDPARHYTVCFISEFDALPEIGHACGHNLIAIGGVASALAVQCMLKRQRSHLDHLEGRVICLGTPAEETTGGKIDLLASNGFQGIDFCMMAHPSGVNITKPAMLGLLECEVEFRSLADIIDPVDLRWPFGNSSATDAVVHLYSSLSVIRKKLQPGNQIHGVIYEAGSVRDDSRQSLAKCHYYLRTPTTPEMTKLKAAFEAAVDAAASLCDCSASRRYAVTPFEGLIGNDHMAQLYERYAQLLGFQNRPLPPSYGSTDMGNVSNNFPSLHTMYSVGDSSLTLHTVDFKTAAGTAEAHRATINISKALAMVGVHLLMDGKFAADVMTEFSSSPASRTALS